MPINISLDAQTKVTEPSDIARELFLENPGLSIDEVARALANVGKALAKDQISRIRLQVRQSISAGHESRTPAPRIAPFIRRRTPFPAEVQVINHAPEARRDTRPPFNPPRFASAQTSTPAPTPAPAPRQTPVATKPPSQSSSEIRQPVSPPPVLKPPGVPIEEKRRWLDDWLLEHPGASVAKARAALKERFGEILSTTYIAAQVKLAHALVTQQQAPQQTTQVRIPARTPPPQAPEAITATPRPAQKLGELADIAVAMRRLGIRRIELRGLAYIVDMMDS